MKIKNVEPIKLDLEEIRDEALAISIALRCAAIRVRSVPETRPALRAKVVVL